MASKNAVKVFVRTKPTSNYAQDIINILDDNKTINIKIKKKEGYINNQQETWGFAFDEVMNNISQDEVYERCGAAVTQSALDGYLKIVYYINLYIYIQRLYYYLFIF